MEEGFFARLLVALYPTVGEIMSDVSFYADLCPFYGEIMLSDVSFDAELCPFYGEIMLTDVSFDAALCPT